MENKDFIVFILTHGRPDNVKTFATLKRCGYTGKVFFIVDNEDKTIEQYQKNYGIENVKVFDKKAMADNIDEGNNFDIRIDTNSEENCGAIKPIKNIDLVFDLLLNYYKSIPALSIAFAQGGDFIGGINNGKGSYRFNKRKCMNSFICSTERPFNFVGSINEDVNTYTSLATRGNLFLTIPFVSLTQTATQSNKGGMTDEYALTGTYVKSFHTILMHPSGTKIAMMNAKNIRLHHSINWGNTTPMIIDEKYKIKPNV